MVKSHDRTSEKELPMPHVVALYRYPVKGFTPEACDSLTVLDEGRIAGDRVLGVRFADTEAADDAWSRKSGMVALINTPGLTCLNVRFDQESVRLQVSLGTSVLFDEALNSQGRLRLAAVLAAYVIKLDVNPLTDHPERLPLRVIGDGHSPRYHDEPGGRITLHGRGSLEAVQAAVGEEVSELRFRSNVAVDGLTAWEEQSWVGRKVCIGAVEVDVVKSKTRCLVTHANPATGQRDLAILTTLTQKLGQENPVFAVAMIPTGAGGQIRIGDGVALVN
jgi:uncharacterized protein YcbX